MAKLTIITPTYNGLSLLKKHIRTFQSHNSRYPTIFVDNGSTDESCAFIRSNFSQAKCVNLGSNYGFTKACNQGAKIANTRWLLFLNNDCVIDSKNIDTLVQFAEDRKLVATQPVIYSSHAQKNKKTTEQSNIENIGYVVNLKKGKADTITNYESYLKNDTFQISNKNIWKTGKFYGFSATCLLIRKDIFETIGMFDESLHSYLEDIELFIRLAIHGYSYEPCLKAKAKHQHMATSSKMGIYKEKRDFINWIKIILKHYPLVFLLRNFPFLMLERARNLNGVVKKFVKIHI